MSNAFSPFPKMHFFPIQSSRLIAILLAFCIWCVGSAQEPHPKNDQELILTLWKAIRETASDVRPILKANRQLVTADLWEQIESLAGQKYYENSDHAFLLYNLARQVCIELNDQKLLAKTFYDIARSYSGLGEFDSAKAAYLESEKAFVAAGLNRDVIYILSDLGTISLIQERYEDAQTYSERSLQLAESLRDSAVPAGAWPDSFGVTGSLRTLAALSLRDGNSTLAVEQLQTAVNLLTKLETSGNYHYYLAETYAALGRALTSYGDHVKALAALTQAMKTASGPQVPNIFNSIGYLYLEQENYSQATAQFEQSLKIYRAEKNLREEARVLLNLGVLEQRQGHLDAALRLFNQSLEGANTSQIYDVQIAAGEGIGVVLTAQNRFEAALSVLNNALTRARELNDRTREIELLWRTSQTYYEKQDYNQALVLAQDALHLARTTRLPKLTYLTTTTLGQIYAATDRTELAITTLIDAVNQIEAMRDQVAGRDESVQIFFENKVRPYQFLANLLNRQGKASKALLYIDRAKARVLLDSIGGRNHAFASVLSQSELIERERLNKRIFDINRQISLHERAPSPALNDLYMVLDSARVEFQLFQDRIYVAHPELNLRSGPVATAETINALHQSNDEAFLEYVVDEPKVGLFLITRDQAKRTAAINYVELSITPQELERKVEQFHRLLAERRPGFETLGHELYQALVQPVAGYLRKVNTLCIVPDGILWNLPFQALIAADKHYLTESHSIYYAPSLSVLDALTKLDDRPNDGSLIAFGNPAGTISDEECPLPAAEVEVKTITRIRRSAKKTVFVGPQATEKTFKLLAPDYETIHLATHGILDNRDPMYSHLVLTKTGGDVENDGLLEAREIINMKLDADLAVLSACETANGRISPGEGVIGMSWAFFIAGTRSLLVSQWRVNSSSTSQLMMNFYKARTNRNRTHLSKAGALRGGSLRLLKDHRYRHPFYWAGFVMIGSND